MAFLELTNINKLFTQGHYAVDNFNLNVERGEFISFLGPSGCGKTTTLRMIAGFETPSSGSIKINGFEITNKPPNQRQIGMVFQSYALFPNMTIGGNIGFGLMIGGKKSDEIKKRVGEMLDLIHLPNYGDRYPYQLSGGQQQRVALARAIAIQPQLLLLDEPLSALDAKIRVELRAEIRRIQRELGITTVYVTHDQEEALSLSDRIVVMNSGKIEQVGTPFEIYNYPTTAFAASFVGQLNLMPITVADAASGRSTFNGISLNTSQPTSLANGSSAKLALRPEEMNFGKVDGKNLLDGKVESITFLGSIVRTRVDIGGFVISVDLFNERKITLPQVGEQVTVNFPAHACWILE
ncbi:MAG: ABC transporter ATP-binding protein [Chloroflexi bacterium]|nr:ABC transporter ATP-binding protein [Chloroflexota bacterium]MBI5714895.1 ABC transporter ATP-binding protein [Chloroflexota bacterium]